MEIFYVQHQQFSIITTKQGRLRAMQKIGLDGAFRLISHLLKDTVDVLTIDIVTKGVIRGESPRHKWKKLVRGRKLIINGKEIRTADFFEKVGICIEVDGRPMCFNNKSDIKELAHRTLFSWEDVLNPRGIYNLKQTLCLYKRELTPNEINAYIEEARMYIASQIPHEDVKETIRSASRNLYELVSVNQEESVKFFEKQEESINRLAESIKEYGKDARGVMKYPSQLGYSNLCYFRAYANNCCIASNYLLRKQNFKDTCKRFMSLGVLDCVRIC